MISFLLGYKRIYKDSLRRRAPSMKTCFNSRRNALFTAYIPVCIFFLFFMLTAKERHVRFVIWFLVCLRGLVVKADGGTLVARWSTPLWGRFESESSFNSASEDWNKARDSNPQPQSWKG